MIRSTTPKLFALASGIQWFTLGSTFWGLLITGYFNTSEMLTPKLQLQETWSFAVGEARLWQQRTRCLLVQQLVVLQVRRVVFCVSASLRLP